ncbi:hypothetical protein N9F34_02480 [Alphaproteobacteria bacterium]|nr:hypothetical protein [Alphaproteobacteria bacterium]
MKVVVVDKTQLDLLRPGFRHFHDREVAEIKARLGDFVLFNTNTGIDHSAWGSFEDHENVMVRNGWLDKEDLWAFDMHR